MMNVILAPSPERVKFVAHSFCLNCDLYDFCDGSDMKAQRTKTDCLIKILSPIQMSFVKPLRGFYIFDSFLSPTFYVGLLLFYHFMVIERSRNYHLKIMQIINIT
jgi:hypothetical protein